MGNTSKRYRIEMLLGGGGKVLTSLEWTKQVLSFYLNEDSSHNLAFQEDPQERETPGSLYMCILTARRAMSMAPAGRYSHD